jgi:hypothetical protein
MPVRQDRETLSEVDELTHLDAAGRRWAEWREEPMRAILEEALAGTVQACGRSEVRYRQICSAIRALLERRGGNRHNPLNWHLSPVDGFLTPGARNITTKAASRRPRFRP